jgi:hypothetical protein
MWWWWKSLAILIQGDHVRGKIGRIWENELREKIAPIQGGRKVRLAREDQVDVEDRNWRFAREYAVDSGKQPDDQIRCEAKGRTQARLWVTVSVLNSLSMIDLSRERCKAEIIWWWWNSWNLGISPNRFSWRRRCRIFIVGYESTTISFTFQADTRLEQECEGIVLFQFDTILVLTEKSGVVLLWKFPKITSIDNCCSRRNTHLQHTKYVSQRHCKSAVS